jgi:hypothetical protein
VAQANERRRELAGEGSYEPVPGWRPNRLRHPFATEARKRHGIEAARTARGHSTAAVSEVSAERDLGPAAVCG